MLLEPVAAQLEQEYRARLELDVTAGRISHTDADKQAHDAAKHDAAAWIRGDLTANDIRRRLFGPWGPADLAWWGSPVGAVAAGELWTMTDSLTMADAAAVLAATRQTVYDLLASGDLVRSKGLVGINAGSLHKHLLATTGAPVGDRRLSRAWGLTITARRARERRRRNRPKVGTVGERRQREKTAAQFQSGD